MRRPWHVMGRSQSLTWAWVWAIVLLMAITSSAHAQANSVAQSTREVSFTGIGGIQLAGTLVVPAHPAGVKVPGALIIAGSGPVDRNGNAAQLGLKSDLYRQIADLLAKQGIATLRYDKRAVGGSTLLPTVQDPQHPTADEIAAIQAFLAWDNYVGDAAAGLRYLQQQPEIDPRRTALVGHSEGTYISEQVATQGQAAAPRPAALVLISAPGRPYDAVVREQVTNALQRVGATPDVTTLVLDSYDAIVTTIKQTGHAPSTAIRALQQNSQVPAPIVRLLASLFTPINDALWYGAFQVDPTVLVARYPGPVLIVQGASDKEVSAAEDTPALDRALHKRSPDDHEVYIVSNASHSLKSVRDATQDPGQSGPILPDAATKLGSWLAGKVAGDTATATAPVSTFTATSTPAAGMPSTGYAADRMGLAATLLTALLAAALLGWAGWRWRHQGRAR